MRAKQVFEFIRNSDPLDTLDIGKFAGLEAYLFPEIKNAILIFKQLKYNFSARTKSYFNNNSWYTEFETKKSQKNNLSDPYYSYKGYYCEWMYTIYGIPNQIKFNTKNKSYKYEFSLLLVKQCDKDLRIVLKIYEDNTMGHKRVVDYPEGEILVKENELDKLPIIYKTLLNDMELFLKKL